MVAFLRKHGRRLRNFVGKIINRGKIPSTGSRQSGYKISYDSQVKSVVNGSIIVGLDFLSIENIFSCFPINF